MKPLLTALLLASPLAAFDFAGLSNLFGNLSSILFPGATATRTKSIAPTFFEPGGGPGKLMGNVNVYNGQPVYTGITLGALSVRGILAYSIDLAYGGPTKGIVEADNRKAPTGWAGLGFDLSVPFVSVNDKGTFASGDDVVFCNLGPFGGGQILQSANNTLFLSKNPYIRIETTLGSGGFAGQWVTWTFIFPDGRKMVFGRDTGYAGDEALRTVARTGALLKSSPYAGLADQRFIYRWDIRSYQDVSGANRILFDHSPFLESAGGGRNYVRESYLRSIRWRGQSGQEVERYDFTTLAKGAGEYSGYAQGEPRDDQKLFETRALDSVKCFKEGRLTHFLKMNWQFQGGKRLLSSVQPFFANPRGGFQSDNGWSFTYEDGARFYLLKSVTGPSGRIDRFEYGQVAFKDAIVQDRSTYRMLDTLRDTLRLPTDPAKLSAWRNESFCDERFCWLVVKDGDEDFGTSGKKHNIYVEVKRNMGNFFDSLPQDVFRASYGDDQTPVDQLRFMSGGNYFLMVDERLGIVNLWEWNGITFLRRTPFAGDARYTASAGFGGAVRVFPSSNYFLVWIQGAPSQVVPVLNTPSGQWVSVNRNTSACDFNNKTVAYGESVRNPASAACLEWSSPNLLIAAMGSFFVVNHQETDVFNAFALNASATGFIEISSRFTRQGVPQLAGFPMNMQTQVDQVIPASDYFLFNANLGGSFAFQAVYFDGDSLRAAGGVNGSSQGPFRLYSSAEYFIQADNLAGMYFWQKVVKPDAAGGDSIGFEARAIPGRTDLPDPATADLRVRTHGSAFTIEYYSPGEIGFRPLADPAQPSNYAAYLYQVSRAFPLGFLDRTGALSVNGKRLYDVSFSFSDDMLSGTYAFATDDQGLCRTGHDCTVTQYTARTFPESPGTYLNAPIAIVLPDFFVANRQSIMSNSARLGQFSALDQISRRVVYRLYQFDGESYNAPSNQWVVRRVVTSSGQTPETGANTLTWQYDYDKPDFADPTAGIVEFNTHLQLPQFETCVMRQVSPGGGTVGGSRTVMHIDIPSRPLNGPNSSLVGTERNSVTFGSDTLMVANTYSAPFKDPAWPEALFINRLDSTAAREIAPNGARQTQYLRYFNYNSVNGAPHFTLTDFPRVTGSAGLPYNLRQVIFDGNGLQKQFFVYARATRPDFNQLQTADPSLPFSTLEVVQTAKRVDSAFLPIRDSLWRDTDPALTAADLKNGTVPQYNPGRGWILNGAVTRFNGLTQPMEQKVDKSQGNPGAAYTSTFYEGLRSDPVGLVWNARLDNCAVLLAENGNASLPGGNLDAPARWSAGGAAFSTAQAHTGRYAFRVADNVGPNTRLFLKDVTTVGFGYKVSAWFHSAGTTPVMTVERRNAAGTLLGTHAGTLAEGSFTPNRWQRWEVVLTNAQLRAGGLFNPGQADFLQVRFGTGSPAGNSGRIVLVDDIVCYPSRADFTLTTFDYRGSLTSSTSASHRTTLFDQGYRGETMAVRDDRYRIFNQSAAHQMGENQ